MQVVVLASQKGGSGKTTLSGHLAVEAERSGMGPVVLIDTDPQGSLSDWWNARGAETPAFARVAIEDLADCLKQLREMGVKFAVIDTPPAITQSIARVVEHADLVLIPARPSPHDLRAVGATVDIVEHFNKPLVFVINAATARARITGESAVALSQHGTVAPVTLHHRVDFAASMVNGKTIGEIDPKSKSAKEVSGLWEYVAGRLDRLKGTPASVTEAPRISTNLEALSPLTSSSPAEVDEEDVTPAPEPVVEAKPEVVASVEPTPEVRVAVEPLPQPEPEVAAMPAHEPEVVAAVEPESIVEEKPAPVEHKRAPEPVAAAAAKPAPTTVVEEDDDEEYDDDFDDEDFSAAIREGASVAFAVDPSLDLRHDFLPITYQLTRPPEDVQVPPPMPVQSAPEPRVAERRPGVFGRRRSEPRAPYAPESHATEKMR